jgi:CubicO group peptidase (beta-lactamase class C family)
MKKRLLFGLLALIAFANLLVVLTDSTFLYPALYHNFPNIDDYEFFDNRTISKSSQPQPWGISSKYNKKELAPSLTAKLAELKSVAFVVIKDDSIVTEKYWDGYSAKSFSNSFSAAKSHVSALIGIALKEGKIKSLDDPIANYVPSFKTNGKEKIKIIDVLKMSSGLNWEESYAGPLSMTTEAYYGDDIEGIINGLKPASPAGQKFKYLSGDTQVLAMVLKGATGKSLSELAEEKIWEPLGYENDAFWSVDKKEGVEKAYCCINSNARDFAKIAKLYMQNGQWNGQQLLDSSFVQASISPAAYQKETAGFYGYMWWLFDENTDNTQNVFYARGILGQYIIAIPEKNIIIVRLGHLRDKNKTHRHPREIGIMVNAVNAMY